MSLIDEYEFKKCVDRYKGDRHAIKFNCRDQFMVMSFAQFTDLSTNDINKRFVGNGGERDGASAESEGKKSPGMLWSRALSKVVLSATAELCTLHHWQKTTETGPQGK